MKGFRRPTAVVLEDDALIPGKNLISPVPNAFTHILRKATPYWFGAARRATAPDGEFAAGTRVLLIRRESARYCRVADARGLYVRVECVRLDLQ